jgi:hypothetical protein
MLVNKQPDATLMEGVKDIEGLNTEKDTVLGTVNSELEVRNISIYKIFHILNCEFLYEKFM